MGWLCSEPAVSTMTYIRDQGLSELHSMTEISRRSTALRLKVALQRAIAVKNRSNMNVMHVWGKLAGDVEEKGGRATSDLIAGVWRLFDDIESAMDRSGFSAAAHAEYKKQLEFLKNTVSTNCLTNTWNITAEHIAFLDVLDDRLTVAETVEEPLPQNIESLVKELEKFAKSVSEASIPAELRDYLLETVNGLLFTLRHVDIFGVKGLKEAYGKTLAQMALLDNLEADSEGKKLTAELWKIVVGTGKVFDWALRIVGVVEIGGKLLGD